VAALPEARNKSLKIYFDRTYRMDRIEKEAVSPFSAARRGYPDDFARTLERETVWVWNSAQARKALQEQPRFSRKGAKTQRKAGQAKGKTKFARSLRLATHNCLQEVQS
jgi:hypothetical protein